MLLKPTIPELLTADWRVLAATLKGMLLLPPTRMFTPPIVSVKVPETTGEWVWVRV